MAVLLPCTDIYWIINFSFYMNTTLNLDIKSGIDIRQSGRDDAHTQSAGFDDPLIHSD